MPPSLSRCFRHCWENSIGSKLDLENRLVQKGLGLNLTLIHVPWSKHSIWIGRLGYCHPTITGFPNDSVNDVNGCSHTKALWKYTLAGPIGIGQTIDTIDSRINGLVSGNINRKQGYGLGPFKSIHWFERFRRVSLEISIILVVNQQILWVFLQIPWSKCEIQKLASTGSIRISA